VQVSSVSFLACCGLCTAMSAAGGEISRRCSFCFSLSNAWQKRQLIHKRHAPDFLSIVSSVVLLQWADGRMLKRTAHTPFRSLLQHCPHHYCRLARFAAVDVNATISCGPESTCIQDAGQAPLRQAAILQQAMAALGYNVRAPDA